MNFSSSRASNQKSYSTVVAADQMNDLFAASDPFFSSEADWNAANGDEAPLHSDFSYWTRKTRTKKERTKLLFSQQTGDASQPLFNPPMPVMGLQVRPLINRDEKEILKNRWMDIHEAGHVLDVNS